MDFREMAEKIGKPHNDFLDFDDFDILIYHIETALRAALPFINVLNNCMPK